MFESNVTRGYGLLEAFLAKQRSKVADKLIPSTYRKGRILDIGCGVRTLFLLNTEFSNKYGLEKMAPDNDADWFSGRGIILVRCDIEKEALPFEDEYFDVVTMLAVIEHLGPRTAIKVLNQVHRVLKPDGMYVMTTPAVWSKGLLKCLAKLRLVSPVEIRDHKYSYSLSDISFALQEAGFSEEKLRFGYFEMFLNTWATATKG